MSLFSPGQSRYDWVQPGHYGETRFSLWSDGRWGVGIVGELPGGKDPWLLDRLDEVDAVFRLGGVRSLVQWIEANRPKP